MDDKRYSRRDFMRMTGIGGLMFASGLPGCSTYGTPASARSDFSFVQLSDIHWGYANAKVNPEAKATLPRAIAAVNALEQKPAFVVFTGDLTQTTDDPKERRRRLAEFKELACGTFGAEGLLHARRARRVARPW